MLHAYFKKQGQQPQQHQQLPQAQQHQKPRQLRHQKQHQAKVSFGFHFINAMLESKSNEAQKGVSEITPPPGFC